MPNSILYTALKTIKAFSLLVIMCLLSAAGCEEENSSREQDQAILDKRMEEILALAGSVPCENASQWVYTPIGAKACGGPMGYIAYPLSINTESFLQKVAAYTEAQNAYNIKWGVISDCAMAQEPTGVVCIDDEAKLVYGEN